MNYTANMATLVRRSVKFFDATFSVLSSCSIAKRQRRTSGKDENHCTYEIHHDAVLGLNNLHKLAPLALSVAATHLMQLLLFLFGLDI